MTLLIIPDIFGATPALAQLARDLAPALKQIQQPADASGQPIDILDPYGDGLWFEDEARAYAHFSRYLGIPAYAGRIQRHLTENPGPCFLLAFSAGASAVWQLAGTQPCPGISGAVCLYGSQIRHSPDLIPGFDIHLVFPESEPHFDVDSLMASLAKKPNTTCEKSTGRHGFMNALSVNFDPILYERFVQEDFLAAASCLRF